MRIVLSGPDGTGKSTIVTQLALRLEARGPTRVTWRRFGLFTARTLNLLGRLYGWSYYEETPVGRIGYHRYRGAWAWTYIALVWLDCKLIIGPKWWQRDLFWRDKSNIIDRFYIDIVADLILSTDKPRLVLWCFDHLLRIHIRESCCFVLTCHPKVVSERRPDISYDRDYRRKVRIYDMLRRLYEVTALPTDKLDIEQCVERIITKCG